MLPKPHHLSEVYADQFKDPSVVRAYSCRPPYPEEVFGLLAQLIVDAPSIVLDLGCGTGDCAIPLAARGYQIHAVDPSEVMIRVGQSRPGGDAPNLKWFCCSAETFSYDERYALVVAAESFHWMAWDQVIPKISHALLPHGQLALLNRHESHGPWSPELQKLIRQYSTNRDFQPYDLIQELERRHLFRVRGRQRTAPIRFVQSIDDYVEAVHSRNGFSRERMPVERAQGFDDACHTLLSPYFPDGYVEFDLEVDVVWGVPVTSALSGYHPSV
jgi:trans-aconitate methyltransferase